MVGDDSGLEGWNETRCGSSLQDIDGASKGIVSPSYLLISSHLYTYCIQYLAPSTTRLTRNSSSNHPHRSPSIFALSRSYRNLHGSIYISGKVIELASFNQDASLGVAGLGLEE